jgi:hypothetical protein
MSANTALPFQQHPPPGTSKASWRPNDFAELIAWLDYSLNENIDFDKSIVQHLRSSCGKDYTMSQIQNKLTHTANGRGYQSNCGMAELRNSGSANLKLQKT